MSFEIEFPWYGEEEICHICGRQVGIGSDRQISDLEKAYNVEIHEHRCIQIGDIVSPKKMPFHTFFPENDDAYYGATIINVWTHETNRMVKIKLTRPISKWDGFRGSMMSDVIIMNESLLKRHDKE